MAGQLGLSTLLHLDAGGMLQNGFEAAMNVASVAIGDLDPVHQAVGGGGIWTGTGQPEATQVLQNNRLALDVCVVRMESAHLAVLGLSTALETFQINTRAIVEYLESNGVTVHEDGTISGGDGEVPVEDLPEGQNNSYTVALKENLKLATLADLDAKGALHKVSSYAPRYSDTLDAGVEAHNQAALDDALADREEVRNTAALWAGLQSTSLTQIQSGDVTAAHNHLSALDQLIAAYRLVGPSDHGALDILRGDLGTAARTAGLDVFSALFSPARLGQFTKPFGIAQFVLDALILPGLKYDTENRVTVDTHGGPEVKVFDLDLADVASAYYPPPGDDDHGGNLADRAHYQRLTTPIGQDPTGTDWIAEAKRTRAALLSWMGTHGGGNGDPDWEYANSLVEELDKALSDATPSGG